MCRRLPAERVLPDLDETGLRLAHVTSGTLLAAVELADGRRQVLAIYCPGDVIFTDAFKSTAPIRLRTLSAVELKTLSADDLDAALAAAPATTSALLVAAIDHLAQQMLRAAALGRLTSDERLATFFLELALRLARPHNGTATFDFDMRRDDIADYLGLNRDTLSRAMTRLRRDKALTFLNAGRVIAHLETLAARTPLGSALLAGSQMP